MLCASLVQLLPSRDPLTVKCAVFCSLSRASSYAQRLKLRLAVIYGNRKEEVLDGRTSPPPESLGTGVSPMRSRTTVSTSSEEDETDMCGVSCLFIVCLC